MTRTPPALPAPNPAPNHVLSGASDGARAPLACALAAQRGPARVIGLEVAIGLHLVALAALLALHPAHPVVPPDAAVRMVFEPLPPAPLKAPPPPPVRPATPDAVALPTVPQPAPDLPPAPVRHHLRALPVASREPATARPAHRTPGASSAVPDTHRTANPMPETVPGASQATPGAPLHMAAPACDAARAPYPASARVLHEQGVVRVSLTVQPGGAVTHAHVRDSSGYDDLDDAALAAARTLTCRNTGRASADVILPVRFTLH